MTTAKESITAVSRIAVLGAGSWGSTVADLLAGNGHDVCLWDPKPAALEVLRKDRRPDGVPDLNLHRDVRLSDDLESALANRSAAVVAAPSQAIGALCARVAKLPASARPPLVVLLSKGLDIATLRPLSAVVEEHLRSVVAVLSGPCIAREVAAKVPTSVVVACQHDAMTQQLQAWFHTPFFRVYRQRDVLGVELGGALKNTIAIAAGTSDGLGFGANSKAALLCRGIAEMKRLAVALGAEERTIAGLAGLGDLTVTCFSPHSRNRQFGELLARGLSAEAAAQSIGHVVEGMPTAAAATALAARVGVEAPIIETVDRLCRGDIAPRQAVEALMTRSPKSEFE